MIHHVYTIICKQNEKMYIGQSLNPTRPLKECFELKIVFSSYKKYFCDCKERKLISDLQTTQNRHGYNMLKVTPL